MIGLLAVTQSIYVASSIGVLNEEIRPFVIERSWAPLSEASTSDRVSVISDCRPWASRSQSKTNVCFAITPSRITGLVLFSYIAQLLF